MDATAYDVGAVVSYLLSQPDVVALVEDRIYGDELPEDEAELMPRKAIIVNSAGGSWLTLATRSDLPVDTRTKDVRCYGETPYESRRVYDIANAALRRLRRHLVAPLDDLGEVLLYGAIKVGGPTSRREPQTEWPVSFGTYNFLVADAVA